MQPGWVAVRVSPPLPTGLGSWRNRVQLDALTRARSGRGAPRLAKPPPSCALPPKESWAAGVNRGRFAAIARGEPQGDTYGAGDCFAAGVTAGLASGMGSRDAIALGCCGPTPLMGMALRSDDEDSETSMAGIRDRDF